MDRLNLPSFEIKLSGTAEQPRIYDDLRRRYVALTPEEWVRQHFVHYLIGHKGYPAALMGNEISMHVGTKTLRADTVLYDAALRPRMIVEYKAPDVAVDESVFAQISSYNALLRTQYLAVSNGVVHYCCRVDYAAGRLVFLSDIPRYDEL